MPLVDTGAAAALKTLLIFSVLMVVVPTVLYLGSNNGYFDSAYAALKGSNLNRPGVLQGGD